MSPRDNDNLFHRLNWGKPIRLYWNGWETDTYRLERAGWSFFANEEADEAFSHWRIHLAASSPNGELVISGSRFIRRGDLFTLYDKLDAEDILYRGFEMNHYTIKDIFRNHQISMMDINSWMKLTPVDVMATTIAPRERLYYMKDFRVFQPRENFEKAIYVPNESVDDLFNKILQIQFKESKLQKKLLVPDTQPIIQAKIFSL